MVKIDSPSSDTPNNIDPSFYYLNPVDTILRIHRNISSPLGFVYTGPRGRFDHHDGVSKRGIYYAVPIIRADDKEAISSCLIQIFSSIRVIKEDDLSRFNVAWVKVNRQLKLLDLRYLGALRAGTFSAISAVTDMSLTQEWSRYFYSKEDLYSRIDGIIYSSAYDGGDTLVLYERAEGSLEIEQDIPLNHPIVWSKISSIYNNWGISVEAVGDKNDSINDEKEFSFLDEEVEMAVENAQQNLTERGISYVYGRDNILIEHHPDSSEEIIQYLNLDSEDYLQQEFELTVQDFRHQ